jgi:hypothetical protein
VLERVRHDCILGEFMVCIKEDQEVIFLITFQYEKLSNESTLCEVSGKSDQLCIGGDGGKG